MSTIVPQTVKETAWNYHQSLLASQDAARERAARIAIIATQFDFCKDDTNCILDAFGFPQQMAMTLTHKQTRKARTVIVKNEGGSWAWLVTDMGGCQYDAQDLIACVQARIGARLAGQLTGKVMVN